MKRSAKAYRSPDRETEGVEPRGGGKWRGRPLPGRLKIWVSAVSFPSGICSRTPAENSFESYWIFDEYIKLIILSVAERFWLKGNC